LKPKKPSKQARLQRRATKRGAAATALVMARAGTPPGPNGIGIHLARLAELGCYYAAKVARASTKTQKRPICKPVFLANAVFWQV
jgi:hypothetical protein